MSLLRATNIRHAGIAVDSIKEELKFYKRYFGMELLVQETLDKKTIDRLFGIDIKLKYAKIGCADTNKKQKTCPCLIELYEVKDPRNWVRHFPVWNHIAITVPDVMAVYNKMIEDGRQIDKTPWTDKLGKNKLFFCQDESWNLLEIVEELK